EDAIADVAPHPTRANDAQQRKEKNQDGKLENDPKAQNHREEQIGVFVDRDHGLELAAVTDQKIESGGVDELVSEYASRREQEHGCAHKGEHVAFFVAVEAGGDEHP